MGLSGEDSFESLEEFQMVLSELDGDKSVDNIRVEYEKLIQALRKSRENEKRLMSKCRELSAEIVSSSTKVAAALKLTQEDETTIASLKRVCSDDITYCGLSLLLFLNLFSTWEASSGPVQNISADERKLIWKLILDEMFEHFAKKQKTKTFLYYNLGA